MYYILSIHNNISSVLLYRVIQNDYGILTTCHTQYTWDNIKWTFYLIEQHSKFLLHILQVLCMCTLCDSTGLFHMIVGVLITCHTKYTWDSSICIFYLIGQHSKFLLHTLQVLYKCTICDSTGLFEMIVEVLKTCHTQYTSDSNICIFYLIGSTPCFCYIPYRCSICAPFVILQAYSKLLSGF